MDPDQQKIAIAQACGINIRHCKGFTKTHAAARQGLSGEWRHFDTEEKADHWNASFPSEHWRKEIYTLPSLLPDYLNDLNAMHEAEKTLSDLQWDLYGVYLGFYDKRPPAGPGVRVSIHLSAAQRAEAFLRAIGEL